MPENQTITKTAAGLYGEWNPLGAPNGALLQADNAVIDRDGVVGNRRGMDRYGPSLSQAPSGAWQWNKKLIVHDGTDLKYDSTGTGASYSNIFGSATAPAADVRIHALEAQKNFYFTSSLGAMKVNSVGGGAVHSGVPQVLDISLATTTGSWLANNKYVSYRAVWTFTDANGNLIVGAPSPQYWTGNTSGVAKAITVTVTVPGSGPGPFDTLEIYRTLAADSAAALGDEHFLVARVAGPFTPGTPASYTDTTDEADLGVELYTNPTQETISQENDAPPWSKYMALYKGHVFYANIKRQSQFTTRVIDLTKFTNSTSTITLTSNAHVITITAAGTENIGAHQWLNATGGTASENIRNTAQSIVRVLNRHAGNAWYDAYYISGIEDLPGSILFKLRDGVQDYTATFTITTNNSTTGSGFSPDCTSAVSTQEISPSKVARAKFEQPEAVPELNTMDIGRSGFAILGMAALKRALLVFKEDGIYAITGETDGLGGFNFVVDEVDPTIRLLCPDSLATLDNAVFGYTTQGVIRAYEAGSAIVSRPIETSLSPKHNFANFTTLTHAVAYESDHKYILWTPTTANDTYATEAWVYNALTNTWTRWIKPVSCGVVLLSDDKLYLGHASDFTVLRERKDFAATDHRDESIPFAVTAKATVSYMGANRTKLTGTWTYGTALAAGFQFYDHYPGRGTATDATSRILSVTSLGAGSYDIVLSDVLTLDAPNFNALINLPIFFEVQWKPEDAGNVGVMKQFPWMQVFTSDTTISTDLSFQSDFQASRAYTLDVPPGRQIVPRDHQRGRTLKPGIRHAKSGEHVEIYQLTMNARTYGARTVVGST